MVANLETDQNLSPLESTISLDSATGVIRKDTELKTVQRTTRDPQNKLMLLASQRLLLLGSELSIEDSKPVDWRHRSFHTYGLLRCKYV